MTHLDRKDGRLDLRLLLGLESFAGLDDRRVEVQQHLIGSDPFRCVVAFGGHVLDDLLVALVARLPVLHVDIREVCEGGEACLCDEVIGNKLCVLATQLFHSGRCRRGP